MFQLKRFDQGNYSEYRKDLERNHSRLALVYTGIGMLIPLAFTISDLIRHRWNMLWSYGVAFGLLLGLAGLVLHCRENGRWKLPMLVFFLVGFPLALVVERSNYIEVLVVLAFVLVSLQLRGPRKGLVWVAAMGLEMVAMGLLAVAGLVPDWLARYPWPLIPVLAATLVVEVALAWSMSSLHDKSYRTLLDATLFDPGSGLPKRDACLAALRRTEAERAWLILVSWENQPELSRLFSESPVDQVYRQIKDFLGTWERLELFHLKTRQLAVVAQAELPDLGRLHAGLTDLDFNLDGRPFRLRLRLGAAAHPGDAQGALRGAETALEQAIRCRLPWAIHEAGMAGCSDEVADPERHQLLWQNLQEDRLAVWFQPVAGAGDGKVVWHEALGRVGLVDGRLESLYGYLPVAEATGLMPLVSLRVIEVAGLFIRQQRCPVSVNLSLADLQDRRVLDRLLQVAGQVPRGHLIVELLERDPFQDIPGVAEELARLRAAGCRLALDDFGSGYSNLGALWGLELDIVKIDGNLARRAFVDATAHNLVKSLIGFCVGMGVEVVVEHIETREMQAFYRDLGVDFLQGYLLGKPAPMAWPERPVEMAGGAGLPG